MIEDDARVSHDNKYLKLRMQVEDYAAKLACARARCERAEVLAERWKRLALSHADRHLRLEWQLATLRSEKTALEQSTASMRSPCGAIKA
jgi:hypothetical protein